MNKKQLMEAALAALNAEKAKGEKADTAQIKLLTADYEAKKSAYEAEGKNEVTTEEIKSLVTDAVNSALTAKLDEHAKGQLKLADIKAAVEDAVKSQAAKPEGITAASIKGIVDDVVTKQVDGIKREKKGVHSIADGVGHASNDIEVPTSWSKGNLPVHGKQLLNRLMNRDMNLGIDGKLLDRAQKNADALMQKIRYEGVKALTSTGSGTGDEWVPTDLSAVLLRRLYLESKLAQMMLAREIEMPTNPYEMPLSTTRPTFYKEATENTSATGSNPGTAKPTLTAVKLMANVDYSYEVDEDSIIPILPTVQNLLGEAAAAALEDAIINGDTASTHQDSDTETVAKHAARSFNGLRKLALANSATKLDISSGGITRANILALLKKMKKYGKKPSDLAFLVGTAGHTDLLGLDDVVTVDKRGAGATTVSGELASFLGIPIVPSEVVREDLNASGVYDGTTTTKGSIIVVNLTRFLMGNRRGFTIETDRDIKAQTNNIVASFRKAFIPVETPSATVPSVVIGYNYTA